MKKILFTISLLWMLAGTGNAQHFDFESDLMCWDSAGVKKIQLKSYNLFAVGNAEGRWMGYFDSQGNLTLVPVNEITEGDCTLIEIKENTSSSKDTIVNITCVLLSRQLLNTVNSSTLYPLHELEKHTITVGSEVISTKYYEVSTNQLVESPVMGVSIMGCNDFIPDDFNNQNFAGDTISVAAGDTSTITISGYASVFDIVCDGSNMNTVKLDITYTGVSQDGNTLTPIGNKSVVLRPYANSFYQKWQYQKFYTVKVIAIGSDCECSYTYSHEYEKWD